jgi:hypothetical protein
LLSFPVDAQAKTKYFAWTPRVPFSPRSHDPRCRQSGSHRVQSASLALFGYWSTVASLQGMNAIYTRLNPAGLIARAALLALVFPSLDAG